jgi:hypothetical protein
MTAIARGRKFLLADIERCIATDSGRSRYVDLTDDQFLVPAPLPPPPSKPPIPRKTPLIA